VAVTDSSWAKVEAAGGKDSVIEVSNKGFVIYFTLLHILQVDSTWTPPGFYDITTKFSGVHMNLIKILDKCYIYIYTENLFLRIPYDIQI